MTRWGSRLASPVLCLALLVTSAGCPKQRSTMNRPPEINPPPQVERSAVARVDELGDLARRFAQTAERLPGRNNQEHRAAAQQAFADLSQILPVLFGPNATGVQRQQLRVVENARSQLSSASTTLAPEPTIDTGLRAARDALRGLSRNSYYDHPQLGQTLDRLDTTVSDLDASRGARHQQVVAESVEVMSTAVGQMTEALNQRLHGEGAGTQPAQK